MKNLRSLWKKSKTRFDGLEKEIIHYLKEGMRESRKTLKVKKGRAPFLDLREIAVETGIKDLAEHHDHYLYGVCKWQ